LLDSALVTCSPRKKTPSTEGLFRTWCFLLSGLACYTSGVMQLQPPVLAQTGEWRNLTITTRRGGTTTLITWLCERHWYGAACMKQAPGPNHALVANTSSSTLGWSSTRQPEGHTHFQTFMYHLLCRHPALLQAALHFFGSGQLQWADHATGCSLQTDIQREDGAICYAVRMHQGREVRHWGCTAVEVGLISSLDMTCAWG
jgi:hypothetical protein